MSRQNFRDGQTFTIIYGYVGIVFFSVNRPFTIFFFWLRKFRIQVTLDFVSHEPKLMRTENTIFIFIHFCIICFIFHRDLFWKMLRTCKICLLNGFMRNRTVLKKFYAKIVKIGWNFKSSWIHLNCCKDNRTENILFAMKTPCCKSFLPTQHIKLDPTMP